MLHLAGILTDLLVVPWFLLHRDAEARGSTGCIADGLTETLMNAQTTVAGRSLTAGCCCWRCWQNAGLEWCRSQQMIDLLTRVSQSLLDMG